MGRHKGGTRRLDFSLRNCVATQTHLKAAQTKVGCVAKDISVVKRVTQASQRTINRGTGMDTTILSMHRAVRSLIVAVQGATTTPNGVVAIDMVFCASL